MKSEKNGTGRMPAREKWTIAGATAAAAAIGAILGVIAYYRQWLG